MGDEDQQGQMLGLHYCEPPQLWKSSTSSLAFHGIHVKKWSSTSNVKAVLGQMTLAENRTFMKQLDDVSWVEQEVHRWQGHSLDNVVMELHCQ